MGFVPGKVAEPGGEMPSKEQELLREFAAALESKDKERASELANELLEAFDSKLADKPAAVGFFSRAALVWYELGEFKKAIVDLDKAIEMQTDYPDAYLIRGKCYHFLGDDTRALKDFSSEIENYPENAEALYNRGCIYLSSRRNERALEDFNAAIAIDSENGEAYGNRGNVHHAMGNNRLAVEDHSRAIALEPDYAPNYFNRGNEYFALKDFHCAIKDYSAALDLGYGEARLGRALAFKQVGRFKNAIADLTELIEVAPTAALYRYRAECYASSPQPKLAAQDMGSTMKMVKGVVQKIQKAVLNGNLNDALLQTISTVGGSVKDASIIDHVIYCPEAKVEELINRLKELGFSVDEPSYFDENEDEDREYIGQAFIEFHETAKPEDMEKRTNELEKLATDFGGTYDGWGTRIG